MHSMDPRIVEKVLQQYNLTHKIIHRPNKGYRNQSFPVVLNGGQTINVLFHRTEPDALARIQRTNMVSGYLAGNGFPTRQLFDTRITCLASSDVTKYVALYSYLPGSAIPWEAYTKDHLKLLGMAMSNMHAQLRQLPAEGAAALQVQANVVEEYLAVLKRMAHYFTDANVEQAIQTKLGIDINFQHFSQFKQCLLMYNALFKKQPLHMDFVRGNLLFSDDAQTSTPNTLRVNKVVLTGILDFEKTAHGHPAFDVARTLAFLLVDCKFKTEREVRKYFIASGYNKRGKAVFKNPVVRKNGRACDLFEELVSLFLLYDFYKFLRHNPYEYLEQNEHFVRTRDILAARKMIKYV